MSDEAKISRRPSHWGETEGGHVDVAAAAQEFREWQLNESQQTPTSAQQKPAEPTSSGESDTTVAVGDDGNNFLGDALKRRMTLWRRAGLEPSKALAVAFKGLTVKGYDNQTSFAKTLPRAILRTLGPQGT